MIEEVKDDPKRPWKAVAATVLSFVGTFAAFWIADTDPFTSKEIAQGLLTAAASSGLTGGTAYMVRNPKV
jgi:hypothetical protein